MARARRATTAKPARRGSMALTTAQRAKLPPSAFVYPSARKYPVPTASQARRAGISEGQRLAIHRSALSRSAQTQTMGSYGRVAAMVRRRSGVQPSRRR